MSNALTDTAAPANPLTQVRSILAQPAIKRSLPLIFMLLGLILRGVAFEFRFKAHDHERHFWDKAFIVGSIAAAFFQGVALGAYIEGIPVVNRAFAGGTFDWFAPFPLFTGLGVVAVYAMLGSTWLIMKTEGPLQARMIQLSRCKVRSEGVWQAKQRREMRAISG